MPQVLAIVYRRPQWVFGRHGGKLSVTHPFFADLPMLYWPKSCGRGQFNLFSWCSIKQMSGEVLTSSRHVEMKGGRCEVGNSQRRRDAMIDLKGFSS
jgi:hypothetical protein